ncbi:metalloregulator ArsR/SmtB family transcription factor [Parvibaculum sp.]|uniref:ArsR/SmtB family transcription factor n=1 Tax=Parvibaculum sp. TaxID=2024848 RepID=UPI002B57B063|nr:metalloregulator ArsR/SmtB family transcription factor [Parvibaculum sp.]HUD50770.1 metalloregulator ArsR/SmtB family transcription factor [Parvibaculum sp.]
MPVSAEGSLDATLVALADPTRRRVIDMLRSRPCRAGELVDAFPISAPAMSRHLRVLRESGLIEEDRIGGDARVRLYRLRPEPFTDLQGWLDEVRGFWAGQLDAFKVHVESKAGRRKKAPAGRKRRP